MIARRAFARALTAAALACLVAASGALSDTGTDAAAVARDHARTHAQELGLTGSDVAQMQVDTTTTDAHTGVTHVYLVQTHEGIEVFNGLMTVNVARNGKVLSAASRFVPGLAAAIRGDAEETTDATEAAESAATALGLRPTEELKVIDRDGGADEETTVSDGGVSSKPIDAKLVWTRTGSGVRLAWQIEIDETSGQHSWNALVDADSGVLLAKHDMVVHDDAAASASAVSTASGTASQLAQFAATDGAKYRVYPMPFGSPLDGDRALVENAADPSASPFGWHDTDGVAGAEFTITRGNNTHAYEDRNDNNLADPGSSPDGGAGLLFDFPLDLSAAPSASIPAFVTNLFYWNNIVHDVFNGYGFDEASGNFQNKNYTGAPGGLDEVRAEAQDGSGGNNANFNTPADNGNANGTSRPRMQMFEWRSTQPNPIVISPPSAIAGTYFGPMAGFGQSLATTGPISGQVVAVNDGSTVGVTTPTGTLDDGCQAYTVPAGAIALVQRGACNFTLKIINGQNGGAAAVIVGNNIPGPPTGMSGTGNEFRQAQIPSVMVSQSDYQLFVPAAPFNATISDGTGGAVNRDSDLDAGVIGHEYGHGISNRLTGGRLRVNCLGNAEQMGEGWSDFVGLVLTASTSDRPTTTRGVGTYVSFQPNTGNGIRPTPYTTDKAVNPSTYASVADAVNISVPHGIGYVWNSMLWEMYWNLVDRYGFNPNVYDDWSTGGNNLAIQLVIDGMKFQPCSPGFVDGRDAILAADVALTGGANTCEIWRGFAKRGLGFSASQGSSNNRSDGVEAFDLPAACTAATFGGFAPPVGTARVTAAKAGSFVPLKFTISGAPPTAIDSQRVNCTTLEAEGSTPVVADTSKLTRTGDSFHLNWKTDASWAGQCRRLTLRLPAAADAVTYFRFRVGA